MNWTQLHMQGMPDMELWHTLYRNMTLCLSFDHAYPDMGWRASYRRFGELTTYLDGGFASQADAIAALEKATHQ